MAGDLEMMVNTMMPKKPWTTRKSSPVLTSSSITHQKNTWREKREGERKTVFPETKGTERERALAFKKEKITKLTEKLNEWVEKPPQMKKPGEFLSAGCAQARTLIHSSCGHCR